MAFGSAGIRWRARLHGILSNNALLANLHACALLLRMGSAPDSARAREQILVACRRATWPWLRQKLRARLAPLLAPARADEWRRHQTGLARYFGDFADIRDSTVTTSLVLKEPGADGEKGVFYSSFEYNWLRIARAPGARDFFRDYYLVGASSWSPPDYASFVHLTGLSDDPVFVGISNRADLEAYRIAAPVIEPLPLMACDWINPAHYKPRPRSERTIDILMVANWLSFKRHWLLFEALRDLPTTLSVVLVGRNGGGRTEKDIRDEARAFGVRQDLTLYTDIGIDRVTELQCDARIALLFSAREGSCVAPVECFFANTPVGMMHDCHVGSRAYINDQTGMLFGRQDLYRQIEAFLAGADTFAPREWAMENVTCYKASSALNARLNEYARGKGHPWTRDIAPLCWRYVPQHVDAVDATRLSATLEAFPERYGFSVKTYPRLA